MDLEDDDQEAAEEEEAEEEEAEEKKKAEELRRITERRPMQPNIELIMRAGNNFKSPKCAADLQDQQAVRDHLINTSLLTAPIFYNN